MGNTREPKKYGSYLEVLKKLKDLDEKEKSYAIISFFCVCGGSIAALLYIILYIKGNHSFIYNKEVISTFLMPILGYLYSSYQGDLVSERKSEILAFLIENFNESGDFMKYKPRQMKIEKVEELIETILKAKM